MSKIEVLAEVIIKKLRDENFDFYLSQRDFAKSMTTQEYFLKPRNSNIDSISQKNDDDRFEFLNGLNDKQIEQLDKLILSTLDSTAFNFLREVEENLQTEKSIGLTIENQNVEGFTKELLSGTFFGEYFLWCEQKSKFGEFQY
jgi:hypothetical protein